ncbi:MAG: alpha/beta hydrolase [Burkholderiales bacterium]|nr:alpha/beta hydrolase [Burkholderiales bacterium]
MQQLAVPVTQPVPRAFGPLRNHHCRHLLAIAGTAALISLSALAGANESLQIQNEYAHPHQLVDVGNGRKINLYCMGTGSPTVIFESPLGLASWEWLFVQPKIAKRTRACAYDRAGMGFSDANPAAGSSAQAVQDLHALLQAAQIAPPYTIVGSSYGAMHAELFTYTYPQEVSGLVLIDGQHEDTIKRLDAITEGKFTPHYAQVSEGYQACATATQKGFVPGSAAYKDCVGGPIPGIEKRLAAALLAEAKSAAHWQTSAAEMSNMIGSSADQLRGARRSFGDLPLITLTRGVSPYAIPGKPQSATNKAVEAENKAIQEQVAQLSSRGKNRVVAGAGHLIQDDKPDAVVQAVLDVLAMQKMPGS